MTQPQKLDIIFFGTGPLAESTLYTLYTSGYIPKLVVTKPDAPVGRHQVITPPFIKEWCISKGIPVYQPEKLKDLQETDQNSPILQPYDLAIVASYGKIIPAFLLAVPKHGFLNVHPSRLPLYRGPSPIQSALLDGLDTTAVSIMQLDEKMDHGPLLVQQDIQIAAQDTAHTLELACGRLGGELLVQVIPHYIDGSLKPVEQDHDKATFCSFIKKEQGEIDIMNTPLSEIKNKYRAFYPWPGIFFFIQKNNLDNGKQLRVKVAKCNLLADTIEECIQTVIPEGKSEMTFADFKRGYLTK